MNKTLKEFLFFILVVVITIAIGYGAIKLFKFGKEINKSKKDANEKLNVKWELKLKDLIKKQIEQEERIIYEPEMDKAITKIKERLEKNLTDNPYSVEIAVVDSPIVNAAAFPGGYIVIYSGLLKLSDDPEEIASVIAHEMGHVINRDAVNALKRQFGLAILFSIVTGGDATILHDMIRGVLNNRFSQSVESKADEFAFELLIKSGINPKHFAEMFKKMKKQYDSPVDKSLLKYFGTHPDIDSRIERAEKMSELFRGAEDRLDIDWTKAKKSLPSVFD